MSLRDVIVERIRTSGPLTFAEYMDLALYHPALGYYARADRRSGRAGDFFTSVDLGPVFGRLLARQLAEMRERLNGRGDEGPRTFDLVEAGAGNGRLARDVLDGAAGSDPGLYAALRLTLVERAPAARRAQPTTLGCHAPKLAASTDDLPDAIDGVVVTNELLDAMPAHVVVMTDRGLLEVYVVLENGRLTEHPGRPSTPELSAYLDRTGARLRPGWRAEINLAALEWMRRAARRLRRGFLIVIDYGHEAHELFSATHAAGTLVGYRRHQAWPPRIWLDDPGSYDLTAHVDLTAVRRVAEAAGLETLAVVDQTYFLLGLGAADDLMAAADDRLASIRQRLALKTLLMPGGLGSTHKVMIFGKGVGRPTLRATSYRARLT